MKAKLVKESLNESNINNDYIYYTINFGDGEDRDTYIDTYISSHNNFLKNYSTIGETILQIRLSLDKFDWIKNEINDLKSIYGISEIKISF